MRPNGKLVISSESSSASSTRYNTARSEPRDIAGPSDPDRNLTLRTLKGQPTSKVFTARDSKIFRNMSSQPLLQTAPGMIFVNSTLCYMLINIPGKRIALPTRVEPKVFFANERTFLSWLNFTVILGGLAVGLLNFGDQVGRISAGLFTLVAMAAMIYALFTFHWRAKSIRQRGQGGFDDRIGPTVLALALLAAVIVNFVLRVIKGDD